MPLIIYEPVKDDDCLQQGDLIKKNEEIKKLAVDEIGICNDDNIVAYIITSQSCDLFTRNGKIKTDFINLSIIKDFEVILEQILNKENNKIIDNVFLEKDRDRSKELISRIINQNEKDHGLFYLHANMDKTKIAQSAIVLLRNNFSVNSEYYDLIKKHRIGRIMPEFRNKLGWMIGYLYSRIGTDDWEDDSNLKKEMLDLIKGLLKNKKYKWINDKEYKNAKDNGLNLADVTYDNVEKMIENCQPELLENIIIENIRSNLQNIIDGRKKYFKQIIDPEDKNITITDKINSRLDSLVVELCKNLRGDSVFRTTIKNLNK
ncbi:MAG: hypothetical protein ABSC11_14825 [Smithella sp.]|jgi:hypothetical protein